jgi:hypothetical protein
MKIGFFFLANIHHIYHSAPTAYELSRNHPELRVKLLVSHPPWVAQLRQLGAHYTGYRCQIRLLATPFRYRVALSLGTRFPRKFLVLKKTSTTFPPSTPSWRPSCMA